MKTLINSIALACLGALPSLAMAATYIDIPLTAVKDHAFDKHGFLYITSGNRLMVYDTQACELFERFVADEPLIGIDVSPDNSWFAVAAQGIENGQAKFYYTNRHYHRRFIAQYYPSVSLESGSYMPIWTAENQLFVTGTFSGSGWVPLREFSFSPKGFASVASVQQNSMLAYSHNSNIIAVAESNISSGPIRALDSSSGQFVASANLNWFVYEVAINRDGTRFIAPTYNGAYVLDRMGPNLVEVGRIGQYADHGPVSAAFSPDSSRLFTANWSWNTPAQRGLKMLDAQTLQPLAQIDSYSFPSSGNQALGQGRLTMDGNGRWLAATIATGVRLYDVSAELGLGNKSSCATQSPQLADPNDRSIDPRDMGLDAFGWRTTKTAAD